METVTISLERFEELIRKEALLDKIMEDKDISIYLYQRVEEEK